MKNLFYRVVAAALAATMGATLVGACGVDEVLAPVPAEREPPPTFRHQSFYESLSSDVEVLNIESGDWLEDYGDAAFYGLAFYAQAGVETQAQAWLDRAEAARQRSLTLIDDADLINGDLNEIAMATLGLIEYLDATGDQTDLPLIDELIDRLDTLVGAVGWYLEVEEINSWALDTYGPTSISALIGIINVQYAALIGGPRAADRLAWAAQMAAKIDERAYDGSSYAFGKGREGLFLYPNITMIILWARLAQQAGDPAHVQRARSIYQAIQPLKVSNDADGSVRYRSPYSATLMGAQTDDYSTLSSQNYLMLALMLLYETTGEAAFVDETDGVLDMLSTQLYGQWCFSDFHHQPCVPACQTGQACVVDLCADDQCTGGVLHHWMDGAIAQPHDPEYYCSGCNLQLLYLMWYRQAQL
ncbi:MAG: hypothetical protein JRI68_12875 [Deltaproteobacteria bacterium]|nr:hypothetical protein [Deltaproteobacteria bacterium]